MDLNPRAIELPFNGRRNAGAQRRGDSRRRIGKHRLHRAEQLQLIFRERSFAIVTERGLRHSAQIAGHHRRPTHAIGGHPGRFGDCLEQYSFQSALPHFADDQVTKEALLFASGPRKKLAHQSRAFSRGILTAREQQPIERRIDIAQLETGRLARRVVTRTGDGRPADAEFPLARPADQKTDGDLHLLG